MKRYNRLYLIIILLISFGLFLSGCGSEKINSDYSKDNTSFSNLKSTDIGVEGKSNLSKNQSESNSSENKSISMNNKVIIYEVINMETLNFDQVIDVMLSKVEDYGGYVESSNMSGRGFNDKSKMRRASLVLRIPKVELESFKRDISGLQCKIIDSKRTTEDITSDYFDTEARVKSLNVQEERLLKLLDKSGDLKDIIELERELQNVRYQIEGLTGSIKKWDNLVDYATVTINVSEVDKINDEEEDLGKAIVRTFKESLETLDSMFRGTLIAAVAASPFIVLFAVLGVIVFIILKKIK